MAALEAAARALVEELAAAEGLGVAFALEDILVASINDPAAVEIARHAMDAIGVPHGEDGLPMRASEDFGVFGHDARAAMLCHRAGRGFPGPAQPGLRFLR